MPIGDSCQYWMDLVNHKLSSPNYPQNYFDDGVGCEWLITAPEGHIISLEFDHVDLYPMTDYFVSLFDGVCDQTKELQTLYGSMSDDVKWIISSSGRYMFVRFAIDIYGSATGFLGKIHYGMILLN